MLQSASPRLLLPAIAASAAALDRAQAAAAAVDVLTAQDAAQEAEAVAAALRRGMKVRATDRALHLICAKLDAIADGGGNLDDLLKVVGGLDPDAASRGGGGAVVAVQVIVQDERGG
jgi:hypothetical protein